MAAWSDQERNRILQEKCVSGGALVYLECRCCVQHRHGPYWYRLLDNPLVWRQTALLLEVLNLTIGNTGVTLMQ
jgi:hypothetical protein